MTGALLKLLTRRPAETKRSGSTRRAGQLFDRGQNCAQAVLQAATERNDPELLDMLEGFSGGVGDTGCLCGSITGGVMALGLTRQAHKAGHLVTEFKETFGTTCCRKLSGKYK